VEIESFIEPRDYCLKWKGDNMKSIDREDNLKRRVAENKS